MAETEKQEAKPRSANSNNLAAELYFGTAEKTFQESSYHFESLRKPYNQDDLYQKTGDYRIYEDMSNDDQINVCLQLKKDMVIGSGWSLKTEETGDTKIADETYELLEEYMDVALDDQLEELIDNGYKFGFALSEKIFKKLNDNRLTLKCLKTRHPNTWEIHTDPHGNVTKYVQHGVSGDIEVKTRSLIHYINNRNHQNPYGKSDLRPAYDPWFVKRQVIRYFAIFLEKAASPIPVGKYKAGLEDAKVKEMFGILKKFQAKTALVFPDNFELDFLECKNTGEAYERAIDMFNMFIGRAMFIPDLLGFSGSKSQQGGSQALGREQMNIFFKHIARRRRTLERIVNRHIIQPMVVWNFGIVESYPKFQFDPITEDDAAKYAETFIKAMQGKFYKPTEDEVNHFRTLIKFPEGDVEFFEETMASKGVNGIDHLDNGSGDNKPSDIKDDDKNQENNKQVFALYPQTDGDFHKRVDFKALKSLLEASEAKVLAESQPLIDEIFEDLIDQIQKKKILGDNPKPERIDSIKLKKLRQLQLLFKKNFREHYMDQKNIARGEVFKQTFKEITASDKFLQFLETETFQYVGDWEYNITKGARQALIEAIKDGRPLSSVIDFIQTDTKEMARQSVERYARTKFTEVMNRARIEQFDESGVVAGYQYSAIMDGRTSDICAGLHGKKFKSGNEPIPPLHFNCRSTLIPITIFEDFKPDTKVGSKNIDDFIEAKKGKGFPRR